jgi:hypothetical protein
VLGSFTSSKRNYCFPLSKFSSCLGSSVCAFLPLPPQMKGPILVPTLRLCVLHIESFRLCPTIHGKGVMLLQGTIVLSLLCTPLSSSQPMSSNWNLMLHRPDEFSYKRSELPKKNCVALSWLRTVSHRVYLVHCQPTKFGRTYVASPSGPLRSQFLRSTPRSLFRPPLKPYFVER